ncbi:hypothetical protein CEXT_641591 [Caerostris extrusa]|uniref:Uncharacterized protein n=1 Tax=Caerostris extrusa TaxID=172846 RepID=A0AAV4VS72_CAEEX|nr:hypothetical protein CEXT_641591 [Caerostris extrusa]
MRLASFSPTKRTNRCRKKEREVPPYTWSILENKGSTLFYFRSTSLNANGKDAAIQWVLLIARVYIVSEDRCCNRMSLEKRVSSICLEVVCSRVGIGEELSVGYALSTVGFARGMRSVLDQETLRKKVCFGWNILFRYYYTELLMRLPSFLNKRTNRCRKEREVPHYTCSILETWSLRLESILPQKKKKMPELSCINRGFSLFYFRSTSLNVSGKDSTIQWYSRSRNVGGRNYVSTGTSCSGIPHYIELLKVGIPFSNKKNQQMSKKKEKSPHYTWSILETWSLRLD